MSMQVSQIVIRTGTLGHFGDGGQSEGNIGRAGKKVYDFSVGEPDFTTPQHICDAAQAAMKAGHTHYTVASGIPELKKAIAKAYQKRNGLEYTPAQVVVSNGAKHSLHNVFTALCNPGDEVIIPAPYWVSYAELVKLTGAKPVIVETPEKGDFKLTPAQLRSAITPRTTILLLCSPSNPTGSVYTPEELAALADVVLERKLLVVSDEIYEHLIYGNHKFVSFPTVRPGLQERTIVVNGVSKSYAMTGWRIGWTLSPANIAKAMADLQSQETSNPCSISQYAAVAALEGPQQCVSDMLREFAKRRDFVKRPVGKNSRRKLRRHGGRVLRLCEYQEAPGPHLWQREVRHLGPVVPGAVGAAERGHGDGLGLWGGRLRADFVCHGDGRFGGGAGSDGGVHRRQPSKNPPAWPQIPSPRRMT